MKKIYLISFMLLTIHLSHAQLPGDRVVVVSNDKTASENLEDIAKILASEDIGIYRRDDDLKTIVTDQIKMEYTYGNTKTWRLLFITAYASDNQILLTSQYARAGARKKDTVFNLKRPETIKAFKIKSDIGKKLGVLKYDKR